jgi:hypothetical protein
MNEENKIDETMEMIEKRVEESKESRKISDQEIADHELEMQADGIREKSPAEIAVSKAIAGSQETDKKVEAAGGIDAVLEKAEQIKDKAYWQAKADESYYKQVGRGHKQAGLPTGTVGGGSGYENGFEGFKERYYSLRAWLAKK